MHFLSVIFSDTSHLGTASVGGTSLLNCISCIQCTVDTIWKIFDVRYLYWGTQISLEEIVVIASAWQVFQHLNIVLWCYFNCMVIVISNEILSICCTRRGSTPEMTMKPETTTVNGIHAFYLHNFDHPF